MQQWIQIVNFRRRRAFLINEFMTSKSETELVDLHILGIFENLVHFEEF